MGALITGPKGSKPGPAASLRKRAAHISISLNVARRWSKPEPQPNNPIPLTGVRVNAICPGFFPSKMASALLETISAAVIEHTPLGRLGSDTDLMGAAVYLASDASRHVTGQYIAVDGGASAA